MSISWAWQDRAACRDVDGDIFFADDEGWRDLALCAEVDGELFFPENGGSTRKAKAVCRACPVRAECLDYALERPEQWGVWGGTSPRERQALRRGQDREAA